MTEWLNVVVYRLLIVLIVSDPSVPRTVFISTG